MLLGALYRRELAQGLLDLWKPLLNGYEHSEIVPAIGCY